ncbi:hypothetical protein [Paraburkholderia sp. BCC1876]|uniref:hypothetical protein n=1 Tax=Paraburkholderia sp. BCC1876 TaxID=2676303 RepID=UPI0015910AD1|nr:hypothetical protein [Paraburkholderia sp. BCC1876]
MVSVLENRNFGGVVLKMRGRHDVDAWQYQALVESPDAPLGRGLTAGCDAAAFAFASADADTRLETRLDMFIAALPVEPLIADCAAACIWFCTLAVAVLTDVVVIDDMQRLRAPSDSLFLVRRPEPVELGHLFATPASLQLFQMLRHISQIHCEDLS